MPSIEIKASAVFKHHNWRENGKFARIPEEAKAALFVVAEEGADIARGLAPVGKDFSSANRTPGRLKDSIEVRETDQGAAFYTDAPHAAPIEYGASPHGISGNPLLAFPARTPVTKQAISGRNKGTIVVRHVNHPGNAAQPFMRPAMEAIKPTIVSTIKAFIG